MTASLSRNEHGLTERQELFVWEYVRNGGNGTQAAKKAGYPDNAAHSRAWELLQKPKIQERMATLVRELMSEHVPACLKSLKELAVTASSESVRLQAASTLLDRTGYRTPIVLEVDDHRTQADVDRELSILLGLDVQDETVEEVH